MTGDAALIFLAFLNAAFAGRSVSKKQYGWATFSAIIALGSYMVAAG